MKKSGLNSALIAAGVALANVSAAVDNIEGLARTCNFCHGMNGVSVGPTMPSIGGLSETYLKKIMMEWKKGERAAGNMDRLLKGYTDEEIDGLAKYFARQPWKPVVQAASAEVLTKGKVASEPCEDCHGVTGSEPDDEETPMLNGQWSRYLELEMMKYRDNDFLMPHKKMKKSARKMDNGDVEAACRYYGAQAK